MAYASEEFKKVKEITSEIDAFMARLRSKSSFNYSQAYSMILDKINTLTRPSSYMLDFMKFDYTKFLSHNSLIIFDLDGTIFDTDWLRKKRKANEITVADLSNVRYVKGFERLFLSGGSALSLNKHAVLIITSSRKDYTSFLLSRNNLEIKDVLYGSNKKALLRKYMEQHKELKPLCAFGDDEKDANVYSELKLPFYIVHNQLGYDVDHNRILEIARKNLIYNFRNNYLYDLKRLPYDFSSDYIDDIVVYYKAYYKTPKSQLFGSEDLLAPSQGERKPIKIFDKYSMGKLSKNETILRNSGELASWFNDLYIDENVVLCKVPGHKEEHGNEVSPMGKMVQKINENHENKGFAYTDLLIRSYDVEESKEGPRDINKHLDSIRVNINRKSDIFGKTIYLFDDIVTSGKTMMACVELLYRAGAGHVVCFSISRTCGIGEYAPVSIS